MQHHIQSVHIKLFYFTTKLQSNTHLTCYSHNNQKDQKLNLDRALGGQLIKMGYLLKITTESIGINRGSVDRIGKGGSYLYSFRKSADFCLEEKSAGAVSVYEQKILADLSSPGVKSADMDRNVKVQYFKDRKRKDFAIWIISMFLVYPIGWCIGLGLSRFMCLRSSRLDVYWC
jgi:hypothetical protein